MDEGNIAQKGSAETLSILSCAENEAQLVVCEPFQANIFLGRLEVGHQVWTGKVEPRGPGWMQSEARFAESDSDFVNYEAYGRKAGQSDAYHKERRRF